MSEIEPYLTYGPEGTLEASRARVEEFASYSEEIREAALEYARGLQAALGGVPVDPAEPEPGLEGDPQFIMVGIQQHGRAILFASTEVKTTRFARKVTGVDRVQVGQTVARLPRTSILVGAELTSFEQHIGSDYYEALATLLSDWERKREVRRRAEHRAQLPPGIG